MRINNREAELFYKKHGFLLFAVCNVRSNCILRDTSANGIDVLRFGASAAADLTDI